MPKLPKRFAPILTGFLLSGFMTLVIAGTATYRNIGFTDEFTIKWLGTYLNA